MIDRMTEEFYQTISANRWNGNCRSITKDCIACSFYRRISIVTDVSRIPFSKSETILEDEERCYWGVAWKKLCVPEKMTRCNSLNVKKSPRLLAYEERRNFMANKILQSSKTIHTESLGDKQRSLFA